MIQSIQFDTLSAYVIWLNEHMNTALLSVIQQYSEGEWRTMVIYKSDLAVVPDLPAGANVYSITR